MSNPLLSDDVLPRFSQIKSKYIQPAIKVLIAEVEQTVELVVQEHQPSWENIIEVIAEKQNKLNKVWNPITHLNAVNSSDELRQAHDACLSLLSEHSTWMGQHKKLFSAYDKLKKSKSYEGLSATRKKVIENALLEFKLSGVTLANDKQRRFGDINKRLAALSSTFSNHVLDTTKAFSHLVTDEQELQGLPESVIAAAHQKASSREQQGWLFTLDIPSCFPVLMYSENRILREKLLEAFHTRASDQGPLAGKFDNSDVMNELLALKHEKAQLLGYHNYAEFSVAKKMANSTQQVMSFLTELAEKSHAQAKEEMQELIMFAQREYQVEELEPWDISFYSEKLKQKKFAISDETLKPYFPENTVLDGLFATTNKLFGVEVIEVKNGVDTWHTDVRFFDIKNGQGDYLGSFYLDLYAREGKRAGAWMADCVQRARLIGNKLQYPIAFLTCNFNGPIGDKPALFTHKEVITLFHEFGHGLHHMLTKVDEGQVSGINGVPWDAVELPSQMLENWCWQEEALNFISGHYETGEPLPNALLGNMLSAKNFQSAMQMARQLELAMFDFKVHMEYQPNHCDHVQHTFDQVRAQVGVTPVLVNNRYQHSFSHIFSGGYAAGYYSYKWAEVLSADAFSKFEQDGIFNAQTGNDFLRHILEKGGSEELADLYAKFRGREPNLDALLRHSNIG